VTERETLRQHAEKIRELLGQPATRRRIPPLIDHDGVMRCQSQKCRKPFEDGETVFQVRYAGGIKTFCERCRWPGDTWVSLPCDNCRRPVYRFYRMSRRLSYPWAGIFKACSPKCRKALYGRIARQARQAMRAPITCKVCGVAFVPKRKDAITCTGRCRAKLHRRRHRNGSYSGFSRTRAT
jgi:hypothetical protein